MAPPAARGDLAAREPEETSAEAVEQRIVTALARTGADGRPAFSPGSPLGVAYSGGVDSAVVVAVAARAFGAGAVRALLGVSPSLARRERTLAHATAAGLGVQVVEVPTHEMANPAYRANAADRCFHCKDELFTRIDDDLVARLRLAAVAYGENADDVLRPDRPGSRAASAHAVLRPLADAGVTKAEVRAVARRLGLTVAEKPAAPCLASRIPHGVEVTPERLRQAEAAEDAVLRLGFADCRVRHHGEVARIEVPAADLGRLVAPDVRGELVAAVRAVGFRFVTVDLAGIQSGAFTLPLVEVSRGPR
ncbi:MULTISPECIES: ATP-dependent sacrificial sulfur transferase LarE [unclassified Actinotalea]|uniref:ATP-dependent sacrificial sulfur transferase LarE n=1 Tax=unclassified Actinotalea TaxID=2638618 RepID=UPI0015F3A4A7|nr:MULTISPECIES: ATP-dependent sacrificial sulfur transferase LarE [unclassified Actinotalea]